MCHPLQSVSSILLASLFVLGCGQSKPTIKNKVPLTHVSATVLVDGEPISGVWVLHRALGSCAETRIEYNEGLDRSTKDGGVLLHTYDANDGLPAGEYGLSFTYVDTGSKSREQLLEEVYADRANPYMKIVVEQGKELNLGEIALKTKARTKTAE